MKDVEYNDLIFLVNFKMKRNLNEEAAKGEWMSLKSRKYVIFLTWIVLEEGKVVRIVEKVGMGLIVWMS